MYKNLAEAVNSIIEQHPEYDKEAYFFFDRAMNAAVEENEEGEHVSGFQLHLSFCKLADQEYGPLAINVLNHWGLQNSRDLGKLISYLLEAGVLGKQKGDSPDDFEEFPPFEEVLDTLFMMEDFDLREKEHFFYPQS